MNKFLYILLFIVTVDVLSAKETARLVWPPPPDEPKIEYISSVKKAKDLGIEKGFFAKAFEFLFGEEESALFSPFGIHADKNRIYVTDISLKTLFVFDKKKEKMITIEGSDDEAFLYPIDVVSDSKGNIYVTDSVRAK
ncbi:MAG: hypothetical protein KAT10_03925, partial [Sulfurimonas sp.]|nr:hypothetical protein [Sulfurimonas sp.]